MHDDSPYQRRVHEPHSIERDRLIEHLTAAAWSTTDARSEDDTRLLHAIVRKLSCCCSTPVIRTDSEDSQIRLHERRCKSRLCPRCSSIRALEVARKIERAIVGMDAPKFLTLTLQHRASPLPAELQRLRRCFGTFRRSRLWKRCFKSAIYTVHITYDAKHQAWHPHIHAIVDGCFVLQAKISRAWLEATGDSQIVHIEAVHGRASISRYLAAYVGKGGHTDGIPDHALTDFALAMQGMRALSCCGSLHGVTLKLPQVDVPEASVLVADANDLAANAEAGNEQAEALLRKIAHLPSIFRLTPNTIENAPLRLLHVHALQSLRRYLETKTGANYALPRQRAGPTTTEIMFACQPSTTHN